MQPSCGSRRRTSLENTVQSPSHQPSFPEVAKVTLSVGPVRTCAGVSVHIPFSLTRTRLHFFRKESMSLFPSFTQRSTSECLNNVNCDSLCHHLFIGEALLLLGCGLSAEPFLFAVPFVCELSSAFPLAMPVRHSKEKWRKMYERPNEKSLISWPSMAFFLQ